jgi:hypothetical protein
MEDTPCQIVAAGAGVVVYSLPMRIAAITRGLRRPCITATTHRPRGDVRASVAAAGKGHKIANSVQNFRNQAAGFIEAIPANEFPNLVKVKEGFRMKIIRDHEAGGGRRSFRGSGQ